MKNLIYRDETLAKEEADSGRHHAGYWSVVFQKALFMADLAHAPRSTDFNAMNGAHYFEFTDPVTGKKYSVRVKPAEGKK